MKFIKNLFIISLLLNAFCLSALTKEEIYFQNTDHELRVYRIQGQEPGKTLMIIGGIQGDESGGYLSADLYVDTILKKGNLIIVPRANLPTIINNKRQITKDMNRRFDEKKSEIYEDQIVEILKGLIQESDILLNLHEGGGYYRETWIDDMYNPMKFGQCIIADADTYFNDKQNKTVIMGDIARIISERANQLIPEEKYKFRFNNHNTVSSSSKHLEQRKSATYYALTQAGIPAFGVEVSKQLPSLDLKLKHHTIIINEFLKYLEIIPEYPQVFLEKPDFDFVIYEINGEKRVIEKNQVLYLDPESSVSINFIKGNYSRGYLLDIEGQGTLNDANKSFIISQNSKTIIRKDNQVIGEIPMIVNKEDVVSSYQGIRLMIDQREVILNPNENAEVFEQSLVKIIGLVNEEANTEINFLGYGNPKGTADDRNYTIRIDNSLIKKFSPDQGKSWVIEVLKNKQVIGRHILTVSKPRHDKGIRIHYTLNQRAFILEEGETLLCKKGDRIRFDKISFISSAKEDLLNLTDTDKDRIKINLAGFIADPMKDGDDRGLEFIIDPKKFYKKFQVSENTYELQINLYENRLSTSFLKINP